MKKILVLCSGNSSRSQMAEGYLNFYAHGRAQYFSAGLTDRGINPLTVAVMAEDNIDISNHYSKSYQTFRREKFDILITVCDEAKKQIPRGISARKHVHFSIPDPDLIPGSPEEKLDGFRSIRETVKHHILKFIGKELSPVAEAVSL